MSEVELSPGAVIMIVNKIKPLVTGSLWAFGISVGLSLLAAI
jgi:hypothetical protein